MIVAMLIVPIFEGLSGRFLYSSIDVLISLDFSISASRQKNIRNIKSITLSINIVPKSLSIGILSVFFRDVHLEISPALGRNRFVKYPIDTAEVELIFDVL